MATNLGQVVASSAQLSAWAIAVFGGSVLALLSTSYRRPRQVGWRLPYLLFVPGWVFLAASLHQGNQIVGHHLASLMVDPTNLEAIGKLVNNAYHAQYRQLLYALVCFAIWLTVFLALWVFKADLYEEKM